MATAVAECATMPSRPLRPAAPQWNNFPDVLTTRQQWLCWAYRFVKDRWTKVPYQPDGTPASSTTPATWAPFEHAQCAYLSDARLFDGVGFMLSASDPFVAWDFDHCLDRAWHITDPAIADYVARLDSYTEISPSNTGLRVVTIALLPPGGCKSGGIEVYDRNRYVTITGNLWRR